MCECDSNDQILLARVSGIVKEMYGGLVNQTIADIKALPANCLQSGEDSLLADVWEEFKYQVQREESVIFDAYEETIRAFCVKRMAGLDRHQRGLLWLWSKEGIDCESDQNEIPYGDPVDEALRQELYDRVCAAAMNEPIAINPDIDSDMERFEDDRFWNQMGAAESGSTPDTGEVPG